ncbi:MAG: DUF3089 domain-containing protein [Gemmatimonadota bacterium]|nr:DUF3089 domain-containing protein [Gemmatimonadota bacterium]
MRQGTHRVVGRAAAILVGAAALVPSIAVPSIAAQQPAPNDYADPASWLCRPDRNDACDVDLTTTWITPDGDLALEPWSTDPYAPIDCFYVYPTVSTDAGMNSDMEPGAGEIGVVRSQLARFGAVCRLFAPLYRQFTLTALRARLTGGEGEPGALGELDRELGYRDVRDAWTHYLEHDNDGRGVVLIGHSQGATVLTRLIGEEIDGRPIQRSLVSAILLGTSIQVPAGSDVGGTFREIPLCRASSQTGCIVTYSTYRETLPPRRVSLFGRAEDARSNAGCTNPAALGGGRAELHAYFGVGNLPAGGEWVAGGPAIETAFVSAPGLISAECVRADGFSYLSVRIHGDASDPRTDDIGGDVMLGGSASRAWGLHLIDVSVAMGDLVGLVRSQGEALLGGSP